MSGSNKGASARTAAKRVVSLDALRGFDLFFLFAIGPIFMSFADGPFAEKFAASGCLTEIARHFDHVPWEGFVAWDLIMPLFMFMAGAAIPFSLARYTNRQNGRPTLKLFWRIFKRLVLLWIFGMIVQGNLLEMKAEGLRLYSNTLQAIAAGYFIAVVVYLLTGKVGQFLAILALMFGYWATMRWGTGTDTLGVCGSGSYLPNVNMAEFIDRAVLGRWMDGVSFTEDGTWAFSPNYHYTWILSSLTFGVTTLLGVLAGEMVKAGKKIAVLNYAPQTPSAGASVYGVKNDTLLRCDVPTNTTATASWTVAMKLVILGLIFGSAGWFWGKLPVDSIGYCPLIKHIWTPSMTLFAAGLSFVLLGVFYLVYDVWKLPLATTFLKVIGMNSIFCYVAAHIIPFDEIARRFLYGLEPYLTVYYAPTIRAAGFAILWLLLWWMYRSGKFLRV